MIYPYPYNYDMYPARTWIITTKIKGRFLEKDKVLTTESFSATEEEAKAKIEEYINNTHAEDIIYELSEKT